MNEIFKWKDEYLIGINEIDEQHKKLFSIASSFEQSIDLDQSKNALMNVFQYTREHFRLEEGYMKNVNFPGIERHMLEHESFISEFNELVSNFGNSDSERSNILDFFSHWIVDHICKNDHLLALFVENSAPN
ncbi:MAG: hemerythrin family protein [Calditrichaeota bacterium]|jgi:hemerythrin|nr:hemerythrin family protein [Calditrichota bacterium]